MCEKKEEKKKSFFNCFLCCVLKHFLGVKVLEKDFYPVVKQNYLWKWDTEAKILVKSVEKLISGLKIFSEILNSWCGLAHW